MKKKTIVISLFLFAATIVGVVIVFSFVGIIYVQGHFEIERLARHRDHAEERNLIRECVIRGVISGLAVFSLYAVLYHLLIRRPLITGVLKCSDQEDGPMEIYRMASNPKLYWRRMVTIILIFVIFWLVHIFLPAEGIRFS